MEASTVPASGLRSRWAEDVDPANPLPDYPRPLMVRPEWTNLNGEWEFHVAPDEGDTPPESYDERIFVPFCPEGALSGIGRAMPTDRWLWYRRSFARPGGDRAILHFGAVDWRCRVWVDGTEVGAHEGAYDPFSFDVTDALNDSGTHEIVVGVLDPGDTGEQPRGKQVVPPEHNDYTSYSGIWGTVWIEGVPSLSIQKLRTTPRLSEGRLEIEVLATGEADAEVVVLREGEEVARTTGPVGTVLNLPVPNPRPWSAADPFLYDLVVTLGDDRVESYCGFREVGLVKDAKGVCRLGLNGEPLFMLGVLDQGYWPETVITAPSADALRYDIELAQGLGFNTIRKHTKVEPALWYAMCDRMGVLVWQDMPSAGANTISRSRMTPGQPDLVRPPEAAALFEREYRAMVDGLYNHPSVVCYVVFNEGWGQYDTARVVQMAKDHDPTRLVDGVSGWNDRGVGDMHDIHDYPGPLAPDPCEPESSRAAVLGEFGGHGLAVEGHLWVPDVHGYIMVQTKEELTAAFEDLFHQLEALVLDPGLSAAIYTQTTDVENEANGFVTYDRAVVKMDEARVREATARILAIRTLKPGSPEGGRR